MEVSTTQEDILLKLSAPLCAAPDYSSQPDRQMPVLTFIRDIQSGNYLSCSPSFAIFAHRSKPEEITGLTAEELFGPDFAARFHDTDAKVLQTMAPHTCYEEISDSTGAIHCFQSTRMKITDDSGRDCILGISVDISEPVRIMKRLKLRDELTGVKNKLSFEQYTANLNRHIQKGDPVEFAISTFDVNDMKEINASGGIHAGDETLRMVCTMICDIFVHSPVFRIGGDEFAVISRGQDYEQISGLLADLTLYYQQSCRSGGPVVACGMARYSGESSAEEVFEKALQRMFKNKSQLKQKLKQQK